MGAMQTAAERVRALCGRLRIAPNALLSRAWAFALELLFPARANCLGCGDVLGADGEFLCDACQALLLPVHDKKGERCQRCGRPGRWDKRCKTCRDWPDTVALARYAYAYRRPVDRMIRQMKYGGVTMLTDWMGDEILRMLRAEGFPACDLVAPVPMHKSRRRARGFNHAELIARRVALGLGVPMELAVRRTRNTRQQATLSLRRRRGNLRGAFQADARAAGRRVLLVDDVRTSGATAIGCADALMAAGAAAVFVATLAGAD